MQTSTGVSSVSSKSLALNAYSGLFFDYRSPVSQKSFRAIVLNNRNNNNWTSFTVLQRAITFFLARKLETEMCVCVCVCVWNHNKGSHD